MKKNSLFSLVLLAVFTASASAAQNQPSSELVVLPTYVVNAPRYVPAEKRVNASLNQLRHLASTPTTISLELPALKASVAEISKEFASVRLAKS